MEIPTLFAGRYELSESEEAQPQQVTALDTEPWRHCWSCGSTANAQGEAFCGDCGAAFEQRTYQGWLSVSAEPQGVALVSHITDPELREILPEVWEQVEDGEQTLTLLVDSGREPVAVPLAETAALQVSVQLARLLLGLHRQGVALGRVGPSDLELNVEGKPRLRTASNMRMIEDGEHETAVRGDLQMLAILIESLTETPRTTIRLSEDAVDEAANAEEPLFANLLSRARTGAYAETAELLAQLETMLAERTYPLPLHQVVGAATDVGIVRDHNEDSYFTIQLNLDNASRQRNWGCYIVSDGMGGHAAGEVASEMAIRGAASLILNEYLSRAASLDEAYDDAVVRDVVRRAGLQGNEYILREAESRGNDMGATLTMALVVGDRVTIANVGDSRAYLYRDGKLRRVSQDHSLVMRLVEIGQIREEDIYSHPQRNAVLRSLGDKADVEVDIFSERVKAGDALLLCSDGQWEMTHDPEMERMLGQDLDVQTICDRLITAANQAGGEDNITAVLVRFVE